MIKIIKILNVINDFARKGKSQYNFKYIADALKITNTFKQSEIESQ